MLDLRPVLITGGAGFIGTNLADRLLRSGKSVILFDNLSRTGVHHNLHWLMERHSRRLVGILEDVRDATALYEQVGKASAVGVGQSMYEIERYTSVNNLGTAILLQCLLDHPVNRLVAASSMSIYGEGLYRNAEGAWVQGIERNEMQLQQCEWELKDEQGRRLEPAPTRESKLPTLASVYALSKYDQERLCLMIGQAYGIPTVALRLFNVYGTRQSLSNPYTGVLAIFAARYLNQHPPFIYEDGLQQRDFVSVHDVARAFRLALESDRAAGQALNIGSGRSLCIKGVALQMGRLLNQEHLTPQITGKYRRGDIRHCFGDIEKARHVLGYRPSIVFEEGLKELSDWLSRQGAIDRLDEATAPLSSRGLTR
ncbi:MAG TPA: nucleoside-diphosphate-sugar epimerase [Verrucomicrobia bacterium]|nr:MAG: nucleoside-diphosphate-sugar epimerase [Lentisphaerae bacterium GWF2_57_35]HBA83714.1 nucleoside-diphosphate-sugar epimerase [Verrucomicrobiota bacterium]